MGKAHSPSPLRRGRAWPPFHRTASPSRRAGSEFQASQRALRRHPTEPESEVILLGCCQRIVRLSGERATSSAPSSWMRRVAPGTREVRGCNTGTSRHGRPSAPRASVGSARRDRTVGCGHRRGGVSAATGRRPWRTFENPASTEILDIAGDQRGDGLADAPFPACAKGIEFVLEGHDIRLSRSEAEDDPAGGNLRCDQSGEKGNKFQEDRHGGAPAEVRKAGREGRPAAQAARLIVSFGGGGKIYRHARGGMR